MKKTTMLLAILVLSGCGQDISRNTMIHRVENSNFGYLLVDDNPGWADCFGVSRSQAERELNKLFEVRAWSQVMESPQIINPKQQEMIGSDAGEYAAIEYIKEHSADFLIDGPDHDQRKKCNDFFATVRPWLVAGDK